MKSENFNISTTEIDLGDAADSVPVKEIPDQDVKNKKNSAFSFDEVDYKTIIQELKQASPNTGPPKLFEDKEFK